MFETMIRLKLSYTLFIIHMEFIS